MADLTFTVPLPPRSEEEQGAYLLHCKDLAWAAVGELEEDERRAWPIEEKVRCEIKVFGPIRFKKPIRDLDPLARAIGGVLWHPEKSQTLLTYTQSESNKPRIEVSVTRRKLVSNGPTKHYEF
jgi:hypothetical protein